MDEPEVLIETLPHRLEVSLARKIALTVVFQRFWWVIAMFLVAAEILWLKHFPMWLVALCALYTPVALVIEVERRLRRDRRLLESVRTSSFGPTTWTIEAESGSRSDIRYQDLNRAYEITGALMIEQTRDSTFCIPLRQFKSEADIETVRGILRSAGLMED